MLEVDQERKLYATYQTATHAKIAALAALRLPLLLRHLYARMNLPITRSRWNGPVCVPTRAFFRSVNFLGNIRQQACDIHRQIWRRLFQRHRLPSQYIAHQFPRTSGSQEVSPDAELLLTVQQVGTGQCSGIFRRLRSESAFVTYSEGVNFDLISSHKDRGLHNYLGD